VVDPAPLPDRDELVEHLLVEGVHHLRPVQRDRRDMVSDVEQDGLVVAHVVFLHSAMCTFLRRISCSSPSRPPSLPWPLAFQPPNGAAGGSPARLFTETYPASSAAATRCARR